MRPLAHSFLYCCPLRTGGVFIALAHMFVAGFLLFVDGEYLDDFDARFEQSRRAGNVDGTAVEYNLEKMLLLVDLLIQALGCGFAIVLLLGALKGKPRLVLAWAVFALLAFTLYASRTVGLSLSHWHSSLSHSYSTLALITVVTLYCAAAMLKLYQEQREVECARQGNPSPSGHLHPHHHAASHAGPYAKASLEPHFERI